MVLTDSNEWKGVLRSFQHIVRWYWDNNLWRDETRVDNPFRHTLARWELTLARCLRFWGQQH